MCWVFCRVRWSGAGVLVTVLLSMLRGRGAGNLWRWRRQSKLGTLSGKCVRIGDEERFCRYSFLLSMLVAETQNSRGVRYKLSSHAVAEVG